jgi:hypothetical protein
MIIRSLRSALSSAMAAGLVCFALLQLYDIAWFDARATSLSQACEGTAHSERFRRTELYLGMKRRDGSAVAEAAFQHFVDTEITPRFPSGFTLLSGRGQYRDRTGTIVQEDARVLVVLYLVPDVQASERIEAIRDRYKHAFAQDSVLRSDADSCASF